VESVVEIGANLFWVLIAACVCQIISYWIKYRGKGRCCYGSNECHRKG
jgi:hypothetical protein